MWFLPMFCVPPNSAPLPVCVFKKPAAGGSLERPQLLWNRVTHPGWAEGLLAEITPARAPGHAAVGSDGGRPLTASSPSTPQPPSALTSRASQTSLLPLISTGCSWWGWAFCCRRAWWEGSSVT